MDTDGDGTADESTHFVYDGTQIVLEFDDPDGPGPAEVELAHRYLWGPAVDQILADEQVTSPSTPGDEIDDLIAYVLSL